MDGEKINESIAWPTPGESNQIKSIRKMNESESQPNNPTRPQEMKRRKITKKRTNKYEAPGQSL